MPARRQRPRTDYYAFFSRAASILLWWAPHRVPHGAASAQQVPAAARVPCWCWCLVAHVIELYVQPLAFKTGTKREPCEEGRTSAGGVRVVAGAGLAGGAGGRGSGAAVPGGHLALGAGLNHGAAGAGLLTVPCSSATHRTGVVQNSRRVGEHAGAGMRAAVRTACEGILCPASNGRHGGGGGGGAGRGGAAQRAEAQPAPPQARVQLPTPRRGRPPTPQPAPLPTPLPHPTAPAGTLLHTLFTELDSPAPTAGGGASEGSAV